MSAGGMARLVVTDWHLAVGLDVVLVALAATYVRAAFRRARHWPGRRTAAFLGGLAIVAVALQSGLDTMDDRLLSVHMVQHMLLLMAAPLLLLIGRPHVLALRALHAGRRAGLLSAMNRLRPVTHPASALAIFYVVLVGTHLPGFYDATLRHPVLHELEHAVYLGAGLLLLWPLLDADPVPAHRLGGLGRLVFMLAVMPAMALVGAYLNRHTPLVYPPYAAPTRELGINPLTDQDQAGAIMWVAGGLFMATVGLGGSLAAMVRAERRQQAREGYGARTVLADPDPGAAL
jgi:cytochrome c oxidase assembly factor CtaG